jgi:hypothetical protein
MTSLLDAPYPSDDVTILLPTREATVTRPVPEAAPGSLTEMLPDEEADPFGDASAAERFESVEYADTLLSVVVSPQGHVGMLHSIGMFGLRWKLEDRVRSLLDRGRVLATAGFEATIELWDMPEGRCTTNRFVGHDQAPYEVTYRSSTAWPFRRMEHDWPPRMGTRRLLCGICSSFAWPLPKANSVMPKESLLGTQSENH